MGESNDLREKVLSYLNSVSKAKSRDIADSLGIKKSEVDKVLRALGNEDIIEYLYLGTSYVRIKGKED
ncbi:MAG: ArsR family transcriptional regulator [Bacillota bacterium]|nr:ArsR family transcriptional regulator [Clostridia bacterium]